MKYSVPAHERKRPIGWYPNPPRTSLQGLWPFVVLGLITLPLWIVPFIAGCYLKRKFEL